MPRLYTRKEFLFETHLLTWILKVRISWKLLKTVVCDWLVQLKNFASLNSFLLKFYVLYVLFLLFLWMSQQDLLLYNYIANRKYSWDSWSDDDDYSFSLSKNSLYTSWPSRLGSGPYTTVGDVHTVYTHTHLCVLYVCCVSVRVRERKRKREYVWRGIRFELPCKFIDCCASFLRGMKI